LRRKHAVPESFNENLANYTLALQHFDETRRIIHEAHARRLGFMLDEKESVPPSRPEAACHDPEELIERTQPRFRMLALQHNELLA